MSKVVFGACARSLDMSRLTPAWHSWKCALQHGRGKYLLSVRVGVLSLPQEQLIDVFKSVGQVVGFRWVFHSVLCSQNLTPLQARFRQGDRKT